MKYHFSSWRSSSHGRVEHGPRSLYCPLHALSYAPVTSLLVRLDGHIAIV